MGRFMRRQGAGVKVRLRAAGSGGGGCCSGGGGLGVQVLAQLHKRLAQSTAKTKRRGTRPTLGGRVHRMNEALRFEAYMSVGL